MGSRNILAPGATIRQYRIEKVLGQGGFGITYLALDTDLQRHVAIKECYPRDFVERDGTTVLPTSSKLKRDFDWALGKFVDEATTLARFKHPGIVQVLQIIKEENGTAYIVLEFVEGQSFASWLKSLGRPVGEAELREKITPIFDALEVVHDNDIAHRDIAPDNIFIRETGEAVLLDFGAAKQTLSQHSRTMNLVVKDGYSAPEQYYLEGRQGAWTDIYAFAATLYRAVHGKRPVDAMARQDAINNDEPDPLEPFADNGRYSKEFLEAILMGMTIPAKSRPRSLREWRKSLLGDEDTSLKRGSRAGANNASAGDAAITGADTQRARKTNKLVLASILFLATLGAGWYFYNEEQKRIAVETRLQQEQEDWQRAYAIDTRSGYLKFKEMHATSALVADADRALAALGTPWTKVIDDAGDHSTALAVSVDENTIVVGGTTTTGDGESDKSGVLLYMSLSGRVKWKATIGEGSGARVEDVKLLDDGAVLIAGSQGSTSSVGGTGSNAQSGFVAKYSALGEPIWRRDFQDEGASRIHAMDLRNDGSIIAAGSRSKLRAAPQNAWLVSLTQSGNVSGQLDFSQFENSSFKDISVMPDGNYAVAGHRKRSNAQDDNFWIVKMQADGKIILDRPAGGGKDDQLNGVAAHQNGEVFTVGKTLSFSTNSVDSMIIRIMTDNKTPPKPVTNSGDDYLNAAAINPEGNLIVAGHTTSLGAKGVDGWIIKYNQQLSQLLWQRLVGQDGPDMLEDIDILPDGSIVAVGSSRESLAAPSRLWVVKLGPDGQYEALSNS